MKFLHRFFLSGPVPALLLLATSLPCAGEWAQWRGADRSNASQETGLLQEWPPEGPPLLWCSAGLGEGIHSVSVAGGRVFTVGNRDGSEFVFALDAKTGEKLWATRLGDAVEEQPLMRWLTQRTPTVDGDLLFSFSSGGELFCLGSSDGRKIWQRSYTKDFGSSRPVWGFCDYPLVDGDRLICTPFGTTAFIAALNKRTGAVIWQTRLDPLLHAGAGDAPVVVSEACGVRQYIVFSMGVLSGFAAEDGRKLWDHPRPAKTAVGNTPLVLGDAIFSPSSYGCGLVGIQLLKDGGQFKPRELYSEFMGGGLSDVVRFEFCEDNTARVGGFMYGLDGFKNSVFKPMCIELKNGEVKWKAATSPELRRSTLTYADGCLYVRDANGTVLLMNVSPQGSKPRGHLVIPDHQPTLGATAPVVAKGRLFLRDSSKLFCYDISAGALSKARAQPGQAVVDLTAAELGPAEYALRSPRVGVDRAPDAVYIPTPQDVTQRMLQEAGVKKTDVVVDLGCGDGRIVIAAAKQYGCKAIGYEIDPKLVELSQVNVLKEKLQPFVSIEHQDIFTRDLSGADVVTVFLYPHLMKRLVPQFDKLKPGSRIVSHQFDMPGVQPDRVITMKSKDDGEDHRILIWTTPLKKTPAP